MKKNSFLMIAFLLLGLIYLATSLYDEKRAKTSSSNAEQSLETVQADIAVQPQHYAAKSPLNEKQAVTSLKNVMDIFDNLDLAAPLEKQDFEIIHEQSYTLEAVIEWLQKQKADSNIVLIDKFDEVVQNIHHASEDYDDDKVRAKLPILKKTILNVMQNLAND